MKIVYLCDKNKCENGNCDVCNYTYDIAHAKNFKLIKTGQDYIYEEKEEKETSNLSMKIEVDSSELDIALQKVEALTKYIQKLNKLGMKKRHIFKLLDPDKVNFFEYQGKVHKISNSNHVCETVDEMHEYENEGE